MLKFIDRTTKKILVEKVYGERALRRLYTSRLKELFFPLLPMISALFGWWHKRKWTAKKVLPFIHAYALDDTEFVEKIFPSFNAFFTRFLKQECRPMASTAVTMPADARYRFFAPLHKEERFSVKGKAFDLQKFLGRSAEKYYGGTLVFARLCPVDYHRFHFPCDCIPAAAIPINGGLRSVNPLALAQDLSILWENRRVLIPLDTETMGRVLCVAIGATSVGSIILTHTPGRSYKKGEEMGYFSFGGSALAFLFPPGALTLAEDLPTRAELEIFCKMGTALSKEDIL